MEQGAGWAAKTGGARQGSGRRGVAQPPSLSTARVPSHQRHVQKRGQKRVPSRRKRRRSRGGGAQRAAYQMHAGEMWRGWGLGYVGWQFVSLSGRLCALELGRKARGKALGRPIQWRSRSGVHAAAARPNHHATAELAGWSNSAQTVGGRAERALRDRTGRGGWHVRIAPMPWDCPAHRLASSQPRQRRHQHTEFLRTQVPCASWTIPNQERSPRPHLWAARHKNFLQIFQLVLIQAAGQQVCGARLRAERARIVCHARGGEWRSGGPGPCRAGGARVSW